MCYIVICLAYSVVNYSNVSSSGLITSVGERELIFLLSITRNFMVSVSVLILEPVGGSKYSDVEISYNMSFNNRIHSICTTASRSLGFIKRKISTKSVQLSMI